MYRWWIAYKYICSRFITVAALLAVTLSVTVLIIVVAVMEGFRSEMQDRIRGTTSDIVVESKMFLGLENPETLRKSIEQVDGVESTAAFVQTFALYTPPSREAEDHLITAVDIDNETSRKELDSILEALPTEPSFSHLDYLFSNDARRPARSNFLEPFRELARRLFKTQPRTARELFSRQWLEKGLWEALGATPRDMEALGPRTLLPPILIGGECFRRVNPFLLSDSPLLPGSVIRLTSFTADGARPAEQEFLVAGYFKTGLYELDSKGIFMRLSDANQFLELTDAGGEMKVSGIRVSVDSEHAGAEALPALKNRIELELEKADALFVKTETWREARATLLNAVKAEKIIVSIILGVVILFAGFMIFIILTVQVVEKGRDIGILQSIGATSGGVANLFFFAGASICLSGLTLGTIFGVSFGLAINTVQRWIHLLTGLEVFPQDVYYLDHIPVKFRAEDLAFIIITTVAVSLLASLIPARRAAKKLPTEGLRYN
jgi:lipoprotein-releasing system permease protein